MSGGSQLPAAIGRYKPTEIIGSGAMGTVYRAHDPAIDRFVAIKLIRTDALERDMRDEYIERFKREVQTAGRCNHIAIVRVFDFSGDADNPYIVMEMVEGRPLHHVLRDAENRAPSAIVPILLQVLDGLGYAHRLGITHRDVKPGNILVSGHGRAKIVDFGIARLAEGSMTQAGSMLGTPSYMAPEQISETDVDHRADLFAVGALLYEVFAGRPPFAGRNVSDTILRLSLPDPAAMEPIAAGGAGGFVAVLTRALAKPREQRFQSAEEFADALRDALSRKPPPPGYDATVVMVGGAPPPSRTISPSAPPSVASLAGSSLNGTWDPAILERIERALAAQVGPMARVMVRDAARVSRTAEDLVALLARDLGNASDRSQFLRAFDAGRVDGTLSQGVAGPVAGPRPTGIDPAAVEAAQAALVVFIGPMARVLARKAAAESASPQDFIERLCAHVPKSDDNEALRRRLRAEVEPKLR